MRVRMRLRLIERKVMRMLVMFVMCVEVFVLQRLVFMLVFVPLAHVEPNS